jgi:lysophospholipase L1-like esterase
MRKRFVSVIAVALLSLVVTLPIVGKATSAQGPSTTDIINCGLFDGSNFDVSRSIQDCPASKPQKHTHPPKTHTSMTMVSASAPTPATPNVRPSTPMQRPVSYVAMGDSVAAGLGLPLFANGSAVSDACGRSPEAYPYLVAKHFGMSVRNLACSGATAGDLMTQQHVSGPNPQAQLSSAFAHGTPRFLSITAGANDAHWSDFIRSCFVTNCATSTNTTLVDSLLVGLQAKLDTAMLSIQARSNGTPPTTILTGYYQPISQRCAQQFSQITPAEVTWLRASTRALNQTIRQVSQQFAFTRFVPINFNSHGICSSHPWVQSLNGSAPFHPTAEGQAIIAQDVESAM